VRSVHETYVEQVRPSLIALAGAVALVLAIACGNAAVLLLVRASARTREFTIRAALGAGRARIARQLVAEGLVLAAAATATGLFLGWLLLRLLAGVVPRFLGTPVPGGSAALSIDGGVALIVTAICAAAGLCFGLAPLATAARRNLAGTLIEGGRGTDGVARQRLRSALVSLELALSLALLIGAGLLVRSAGHLQQRELGFTADNVIAFDLSLRQNRYPDPAARVAAYQRMLERIESDVHGMGAALASFAPFSRVGADPVETPEQPVYDDGNAPTATVRVVSPSFFDLLEVPLVAGRVFSDLDGAGAEAVAIVSRDLAERLWPNANAVGQRVRAASLRPGAQPQPWRTVVGVSGEVVKTLTELNPPDLYIPMAQAGPVLTELIVRDRVPLTAVRIDAVRRAIWTIEPEVPLNLVRDLSEDVRTALLPARFLAAVLGSFAVFAVILATFGLYGVIAYTVNRRRREIALRMALGATAPRVVRLFVHQGLPLVLIGIVAGLIAGFALSRVLAAQLHGVSPADPVTWAVVTAILTIAAVLASAIPALRATRRHPMRILREEG
jgi:putative ABC transport system permease protein